MKLKTLVTLISLFCYFSLLAQNPSFFGVQQKMEEQPELNLQFKAYEVFQIEVAEFNAFVKKGDSEMQFQLNLGDHFKWNIRLHPKEIRSKNYVSTVLTEKGKEYFPKGETITFQGHLLASDGGAVALTITDDLIYGFVKDGDEVYFIEPRWYFEKNAPRDQFVVYASSDVKSQPGKKCGAEELEENKNKFQQPGQREDAGSLKVGNCYDLELAIASDLSMFTKFGSVAAVEAHNLGVMLNVQTNYDDEFADEIKYVIVEQFTVSPPASDPWTASTDAGDFLNSFTSWGPTGFTATHDLGQIWTNRNFDGSTVGIAWLTVVCSSFRYHALQDFTTNATFLRVLVSHEIGHNFSAFHDAGGSPFIMAPAINSTNTWSAASISSINNHITSVAPPGGCLSNCSGALPPVAQFSSDATTGCASFTVNFQDQSTNSPTSWSWSFPSGSPTSSTLQNPSVTYNSSGSFDVSLTATNAGGSNSTTQAGYISADAVPTAGFSFSTTGLTTQFTNTTNNAVSYVWNFDDGSSSTAVNPSHTFAADGIFSVILIASNACGSSTILHSVTISSLPTAAFTADVTNGCASFDVQYSDQSFSGITSRSWNFPGGNPSTSTAQNPVVTYSIPGTFDAVLTASNAAGNSTSTQVDFITVDAIPAAGFGFSVNGQVANFSNTTTNAVSYVWNFDDGSSSTAVNPSHTFAADGIFSVILIASNACGSSTILQSVTISTLPSAAFTANTTNGCAALNVQYFDLSSSNITSWSWSFPGGSPSASTAQNPAVTYNNPGSYDAVLTASNAAGNSTSTQNNFITVDAVPAAGFSSSVNGQLVNFTNTTTNALSYVWNFGDGSSSTSVNPSHTYAADGTFSVILIASNACGSSTILQSVTISSLPLAAFTANATNGCAALNVQYFDLSSSNTTSWSWSFPGGSPSTSTTQNPAITYSNQGTFDAVLTASNTNGNSTSTQNNFITVDDVPMSGFISSVNNLTVNFINTTTNALSYVWNFGDGSSSTSVNPTHIYAADGIFSVILIASNACGSNTIVQTVTISNLPTAAFSANSTLGCLPFSVQFSDMSSANTTSWNWSFPGGSPSTSTLQNPTVNYSSPGTFDVSLSVSNDAGPNSTTQPGYIAVGDVPTAAFTTNLNFATANFTNNSTGATSYSWDFGDANSSTAESPSHTYAVDGTYTVTLTSINNCGTTTAMETITIITPPTAAFSANSMNGCAPFNVQFNDQSSANSTSWNWAFTGGNPATSTAQNPAVAFNAKGTFSVTLEVSNAAGSDSFTQTDYITVGDIPAAAFTQTINGFDAAFTNNSTDANSFFWDFGDGESSAVFAPSHTYGMDGIYTVELIATNPCGSDTTSSQITIVTEPTAAFAASATNGCVPFTVQFTDQSSANSTSWNWTFAGGDPASSTQQNPTVTFNSAGNFSVTLVVSNAAGSDTSVQNNLLLVNDIPTAGFSSTLSGAMVQFNNSSVNATQFFWNFGDGDTTSMMNPSHLYGADGIYAVTLIATNECGSVTINGEIVIATPPTASFSANATTGCLPFEVQFQNGSSSNATEFLWSFPGGTPNSSTEENPLVVYDNPGSFEVSLAASNPTGSDTFTQPNFIEVGTIPDAAFTFNVVDSIVAFANNSTNAVSFEWDFGDGSSSTEPNPTQVYSNDDAYIVTLTATNECGPATVTEIVVVATAAPIAAFTAANTKGCPPFEVVFENLSSQNSFSLQWSFPGGQPATSNAEMPSVTYTEPGIYDVTLLATNALGADTFSITGFIEINEFPTAGFDYELNELLVNFGGTSANATSVQWNFGDGANSTELNPSHEYQLPGTYSVALIAINSCGADTLIQQIEVIGTAPTAAFDADQREGCVPFTVSFEDLSPGNPTAWNWTFPGGNPPNSTAQNPAVVFETAGMYDVILEVANAVGTNALTSSQFIAVDEAPTSNFDYQANGPTVSFTNTSTNATTFEWIFGDGTSSFDSSPEHTYQTFGEFEVTLTATNDCGSRSITQTVSVVVDNVAEISGIEQFNLFPNPNDGRFTLFLKGQPLPELEVHFYNLLGQRLLREAADFSTGLLTKQFEFDRLPAGVYVVQLRSGNEALYRKIVVE